MPSMDRNLLRLAIYEMLFVDEVEIPVTINESVELAKAYGTDDSSRFVNGILGRLADDVEAGVDVIARAHEVLAERGEDEADLMAEPTVAEPAPEVADAEVLEPVSDEVYDRLRGRLRGRLRLRGRERRLLGARAPHPPRARPGGPCGTQALRL